MEVTAVLNAYQKFHDPSLSDFIDTLSQLCLCFRSPSNSPDENHIYHHLFLVRAFVPYPEHSIRVCRRRLRKCSKCINIEISLELERTNW